jgi:hypothetical protein
MPRSGKIRRVGRVNCFPVAGVVAAECRVWTAEVDGRMSGCSAMMKMPHGLRPEKGPAVTGLDLS